MESFIFETLQQYAYQPLTVYLIVVVVMFLSSFGLPVPEEVSIISLGVLSYMGSRPDLYPPPYEGAPHVDVYWAMFVCSFSVFISDFCVYSLGRYFGPALFSTSWFQELVPEKRLNTTKAIARKYGRIVPGLFRLIPGVRFPGHLICGALGIKPHVFLIVDVIVISIMVPTQIFIISYFGENVVSILKRFQLVIGLICAVVFIVLIRSSIKIYYRSKGQPKKA